MRARDLAEKANPYTRKRLLGLAERYDMRAGGPSRASHTIDGRYHFHASGQHRPARNRVQPEKAQTDSRRDRDDLVRGLRQIGRHRPCAAAGAFLKQGFGFDHRRKVPLERVFTFGPKAPGALSFARLAHVVWQAKQQVGTEPGSSSLRTCRPTPERRRHAFKLKRRFHR